MGVTLGDIHSHHLNTMANRNWLLEKDIHIKGTDMRTDKVTDIPNQLGNLIMLSVGRL